MRFTNCSLEFLRRISKPRHSAPKCVASISEYVEQSAARLTPEHLDELRMELPLLRARFADIVTPQFPHLRQQLELLVEYLKDTADGVFLAGSDASRKETAFAIRYAANEIDIISDSVPEIGYADDSLIVRTVLNRHEDLFRDYCSFRKGFRKIRYSNISFGP